MQCIISSPLGALRIQLENNAISRLEFIEATDCQASTKNTALLKNIAEQLKTYFQNPGHLFQLPLNVKGTPFQKRVWQALTNIKSGTSMTYGALAKQLNTSSRAIGQACRKNPIPIIVPCHRIVSANSLGGFAGQQTGKMIEIKAWLLKHESKLNEMELK